jgi:rhodanese-related sulfurtransferase
MALYSSPISALTSAAMEELEAALAHFRAKLALETDPADVHEALTSGDETFVVVDARTPKAYAAGHVPGAVNLPHRRMDAETTAVLPRDRLMVVYCDGAGCNASTKGALRLTQLGFRVKEMIGGLDWWIRDGFPVARGPEAGRLAGAAVSCGCG